MEKLASPMELAVSTYQSAGHIDNLAAGRFKGARKLNRSASGRRRAAPEMRGQGRMPGAFKNGLTRSGKVIVASRLPVTRMDHCGGGIHERREQIEKRADESIDHVRSVPGQERTGCDL
jgi:hypothetical protein